MRRFVAAWLALCFAFLPLESAALLKGSSAPPGLQSGASVGITGGSITGVSGIPYTFSSSSLPIIKAPTGTMGNNGAITLGTALPKTYPNAYIALPAGAIAAGVPAAASIYFVQMSSATVGTVCNNLMSANLDANGAPQIPGSCTAFSTTGPGAFTGITSSVTLLTITLPASTLGTNGILDFDAMLAFNTSANAKETQYGFGSAGNVFDVNTGISTAAARLQARIQNENSASVQKTFSGAQQGAAVLGGTTAYLAINSGNSVSITVNAIDATATDFTVLNGWTMTVTK